MKVEFTVTADLENGEFIVTCPEVFELKNKGWGTEVRSNYSAEFKNAIAYRCSGALRAKFMGLAKLAKEELAKAEVQK